MTYKIDTCRFLARCSALLGRGINWLAQCQDNVTEWDIMSWCLWVVLAVAQHQKVAMSAQLQAGTHSDMTIGVAKS